MAFEFLIYLFVEKTKLLYTSINSCFCLRLHYHGRTLHKQRRRKANRGMLCAVPRPGTGSRITAQRPSDHGQSIHRRFAFLF